MVAAVRMIPNAIYKYPKNQLKTCASTSQNRSAYIWTVNKGLSLLLTAIESVECNEKPFQGPVAIFALFYMVCNEETGLLSLELLL